jgi:gamma-glutamyltranspeptidase/glutathione hydrolase
LAPKRRRRLRQQHDQPVIHRLSVHARVVPAGLMRKAALDAAGPIWQGMAMPIARRLPAAALALPAALALCATLAQPLATAQAAAPVPAASSQGMVVSAHHLATEAGLDVLRHGGNAVDAAVAVGYALAVTFPEAGNLGGGGFMTVRLADGTTHFVDFRETAPGRATPTMYQDRNGR